MRKLETWMPVSRMLVLGSSTRLPEIMTRFRLGIRMLPTCPGIPLLLGVLLRLFVGVEAVGVGGLGGAAVLDLGDHVDRTGLVQLESEMSEAVVVDPEVPVQGGAYL